MKWKLLIVVCALTIIFTISWNNIRKPNIEKQKAEQSTKLTLEIVKNLSIKGDNLSWEDFQIYNGKEIGSGLYIMWYPIDDKYNLLIGGGSPKEKPMYIYLENKDFNSTKKRIDIRYDNINKIIN